MGGRVDSKRAEYRSKICGTGGTGGTTWRETVSGKTRARSVRGFGLTRLPDLPGPSWSFPALFGGQRWPRTGVPRARRAWHRNAPAQPEKHPACPFQRRLPDSKGCRAGLARSRRRRIRKKERPLGHPFQARWAGTPALCRRPAQQAATRRIAEISEGT
jgi:hypothetical protein